MSETSQVRRVAAFICLAFVLLAALTPNGTGLPPIILVAHWFFVALALIVFLPHVDKQTHPLQVLARAPFSPRPPPER
jgi:fatty acid desaturase